MTSPLRLDEVSEMEREIGTRQQQGGANDRRPVARGVGRNLAGLFCVFDDPMEWGLEEAALGRAAALSALGLGPDIFGPKSQLDRGK